MGYRKYTKKQVKEWVTRNKGALFLDILNKDIVQVIGLDPDGDVELLHPVYKFRIGEYLGVVLNSAYYIRVFTDEQFIKEIEDL